MRSRDRSRLSGGPGGDVRLLTTLSGTLEKGGPGFILEFTNKVHGNPGHDKVQSYFVNSSPSTITILVNLVSTESYDREESNGAGCKEFGGELVEDVGFSTKLLATCAVGFFSIIAFRRYQVDQNRYCGGGGIDEVRLDLIMTQDSMYFISRFQYKTRSPFLQSA